MGSIAENPFRSLIGRHLGFLRRALPGTSGRTQKSREGGGGGRENPPQRHLFVNYRSPRSSASRIIQNGSHEKANTRFSRRRKTPTPTGRLEAYQTRISASMKQTVRWCNTHATLHSFAEKSIFFLPYNSSGKSMSSQVLKLFRQ